MRTLKQYINDTEDNIIIPGGFMVPRSQMPQIDDQEEFLHWLRMAGYSYEFATVQSKELFALQSMVDRNKVKKFKTKHIYEKPIIVANDNFILDGHHRFFAALEAGITSLKVIRVKLNINKLFKATQVYLDERLNN